MHIRWRFRSLLKFKQGTLPKRLTRALVDPGERDRNTSREAVVLRGEKSPYRKPTQVVRKRILRPTGEG